MQSLEESDVFFQLHLSHGVVVFRNVDSLLLPDHFNECSMLFYLVLVLTHFHLVISVDGSEIFFHVFDFNLVFGVSFHLVFEDVLHNQTSSLIDALLAHFQI